MTRRRQTLAQRLSSWPGVQARLDQAKIEAELRGEKRAASGLTENLTLRELEVLIAIVEHGSNVAAAYALGIGEQTVKNHVTSAMDRLGASTRTHAVVLMWPVLRDYWPEPPQVPWHGRDRRAGYERRRSGRGA